MKQSITIAVIVLSILATSPIGVLAQSAPSDGRETLTQAFRSAWLPLESGLAASAREGTPLSAKYEIDDGAFQLSVYTWKVDAFSGDSFSEVIVDYNTGSVTKPRQSPTAEILWRPRARRRRWHARSAHLRTPRRLRSRQTPATVR